MQNRLKRTYWYLENYGDTDSSGITYIALTKPGLDISKVTELGDRGLLAQLTSSPKGFTEFTLLVDGKKEWSTCKDLPENRIPSAMRLDIGKPFWPTDPTKKVHLAYVTATKKEDEDCSPLATGLKIIELKRGENPEAPQPNLNIESAVGLIQTKRIVVKRVLNQEVTGVQLDITINGRKVSAGDVIVASSEKKEKSCVRRDYGGLVSRAREDTQCRCPCGLEEDS